MPEEKVKLPRSSYEELCKVIKAYGRLEKPANLDEVNSLAGVGKTVVSANNAFLSSIGVIDGGKAKQATGPGRELGRALDHQLPERTEAAWREVVEKNEFLRKMALALKIRKTMEESAFVSHIAYSAGEPKSGYAMTGARAVIDILRASGLIRESEGKLTTTEGPDVPGLPTLTPPTTDRPVGEAIGIAPPQTQEATVRPSPSVHIELRIDAKPDELDGLAPKLRKFLKDLGKSDGEEERS
jgi:hypothetical protein